MNANTPGTSRAASSYLPSEIREDFVPQEDFISKDFFELEKKKFWPRVWQMVCREEDIPRPGSYYTYDILDESITVVRLQSGEIAAYYNVCPHRARRLTSGCGKMGRFHCRYHGWQFTLEGKPAVVVDRENWGDCLQDSEIELTKVRVESWGGWVYINMDPKAESLIEFLEPAASLIAPFEIEKQRYRWRKRVVVPCNWKLILGGFSEGYHLQTTHRQFLNIMDDMSYSKALGKHGVYGYAPDARWGLPSPRLGEVTGDLRVGLSRLYNGLWEWVGGSVTDEMIAAADRLAKEVPADANDAEVYAAFAKFHEEEQQKSNRPIVKPSAAKAEQVMLTGMDWLIFPNMVMLPQESCTIAYRLLPNGDDVDSCILDAVTLERFPPGEEPQDVPVQVAEDWRTSNWGLVFDQDFEQFESIQKGMKSKGCRGLRPNPVQERTLSNFHEVLRQYLSADL